MNNINQIIMDPPNAWILPPEITEIILIMLDDCDMFRFIKLSKAVYNTWAHNKQYIFNNKQEATVISREFTTYTNYRTYEYGILVKETKYNDYKISSIIHYNSDIKWVNNVNYIHNIRYYENINPYTYNYSRIRLTICGDNSIYINRDRQHKILGECSEYYCVKNNKLTILTVDVSGKTYCINRIVNLQMPVGAEYCQIQSVDYELWRPDEIYEYYTYMLAPITHKLVKII